ncbi:IS66 family insertion sequence element accessory protein TnpA [Corallococcus macrosporus]|uniref:Transposase n=1 Tax=Corallococcus macrosporus DSM 14697 TaxID=1189310 RepID=A0A250JPZ7_9BACT|nr:hypothetical protein [Corallococcus macrosporus]ATB45939.1 hypothetical protein MYMAC_001527 [Corallococcus macrosporus DSM 14697]ATB49457.1 hypothetical protein MYMAC_005102 [Corallococcus macrosporus DSM 14697]
MANAELWKKRVEEWRTSGLSAEEYCRGKEFTPSPLYRWSSRLAKAGRGEEEAAVPLVRLVSSPARVEAAPGAGLVVIEAHGARVLVPAGADVATVGVALAALGAASRGGAR